jgi:nucleoside-diphosphate-sugar epimerase
MCSTSEVYGQALPKNIPITEDCPLQPINPYAVSKLTQDRLGYAYFRCYGTKVIITRAFGYINPKRDDLFATSFAKQIVEIEKGIRKELLHGDLNPERTLMDVRDIAKAYWQLMVKGTPGEVYNVGSDIPIKIGEVLRVLMSKANCPIITKTSDDLLRPSDIFVQTPCIDKFIKTTNWNSNYSLEDSLSFLLDYQRKLINKNA